MFKAFKDYILNNRLFRSDQKIILAVSGGIDSMVMASLFVKAGFDTGFAHCNFNLRKTESDEDELFVKKIAHDNNIPVYVKRFETSDFASENRLSIQVAARELRYNWFEQLIKEEGFDLFATAHHLDDQIETFFINLFRGSGVSGLRGILPKNGNCIRPILFATRKMVEDYAFENNIHYREDSSNKKDDYLRNRIRHFIVPALEKTEDNYRTGFQTTISILAETELFIHEEINKKYADYMFVRNGLVFIRMDKLIQESHLPFVLFEILKPYKFNYLSTLGIAESLGKQPGKRFFSTTHELVVDRKYIIISEIISRSDEVFEISENSKKLLTPIHLDFKLIDYKKNTLIPSEKNIALLDRDKLRFPLKIRRYREGDKFYPLGMNGQKKLSDFFIDQKISLPEKKNTWLLLSEDQIVWVIGHRIDDRFKITDETSKALEIRRP